MTNIITTKQLCEQLGVSRNFVNQHLRHLGSLPQLDENRMKTVVYPVDSVITWINENAVFSRQTELLDLSCYASEEQIQEVYDKVDKYPKNTIAGIEARQALLDEFYAKVLPPEYLSQRDLINVRNRGRLPWIPVEYKISSFSELYSIKELKGEKSEEIAYRTIYSSGMIRMELIGRKWYIENSNIPKYPLLMPADYEKK